MHPSALLLSLLLPSVTATAIQQRGFSFRPARVGDDGVDEATPNISSGGSGTGGHVSSGLGGGVRGSSGLESGVDDAIEPAVPQYQPAAQPNACLQGRCSELSKAVAEELVQQMLGNIGSEPGSSTTRSRGESETQVQPAVTTGEATRMPMPNLNVAKSMTLPQKQLALFNEEEQNMYLDHRLCFYANIEQKYASLASASAAPTSLNRRNVYGPDTQATSRTPLPSSDVNHYQNALWNTQVPENLLSIYAPATVNSSMTTATTGCSGLGGGPSITVPFVRAAESSRKQAPQSTGMVENAGVAQAHSQGSAMFGAVVAIVGLVVL